MSKAKVVVLLGLLAFLAAPSALAQETTAPAGPVPARSWVVAAAGFGMAVAAAMCGYAQSRVAAAACEGIARNPGALEGVRGAMFLGLVFIETLALFTMVVAFTILFQ
jgi:F-type H+-transporting ATPase subunit c